MPIDVKKYVEVNSEDTPIIRYVEKNVSEKRYGVDITDLLGDIDDNGNLVFPVGGNVLDLSIITGRIPNSGLWAKFYKSAIVGDVVLNATSVLAFGCQYAFFQTRINSFSAPRLVEVEDYAFDNALKGIETIKTVSFDEIETINKGQAFNCLCQNSNLESASFNKLKIINSGHCFERAFSATKIKDNPFVNLEEINGGTNQFAYAFEGCENITNWTFDKLNAIRSNYAFQYAFKDCINLSVLSFPALSSVYYLSQYMFNNMLNGCSDVTVHFPSNMQGIIGNWADVQNGFGGTNTTVLFDLPATA